MALQSTPALSELLLQEGLISAEQAEREVSRPVHCTLSRYWGPLPGPNAEPTNAIASKEIIIVLWINVYTVESVVQWIFKTALDSK